ncbi:hypothetical protein ACWEDZ_39340 [Streptomyces sp. NPDC005047]
MRLTPLLVAQLRRCRLCSAHVDERAARRHLIGEAGEHRVKTFEMPLDSFAGLSLYSSSLTSEVLLAM